MFGLKEERFHSVISHTSVREAQEDSDESMRGLVFFEDNKDREEARILLLDPIRTSWPRTGELGFGSDTFFVGYG